MFKLVQFFSSLILSLFAGTQVELPDSRTLLVDPDDNSVSALERRQWVDSVYNSLSERQRIAQLFVPRLDITDNQSGRALLHRMVHTDGVGGILLGKGTIDSYATLINLAQSEAKVPLMITLDGEWGLSMRVAGTPRYPYNMGLGAIRDSRVLYDFGYELAKECREIGIQVDFAPVLDVNSNPDNPVIGYRSFGENPKEVARLGVAFSKGMEAGGVLSVSKHFPGHGDTSSDSHKTLPTVDHPRSVLDRTDLVPFKEYISAGLSGIMVGHLNVPSLDPSGTPASMSKKITTDLLKGELGFKGLIFTDALAMKGANSTHENNCVRALLAGADVLLGSGAPSADLEAVVNAVKSGIIPQSVIEERCKKILAYKYALGLSDYKPVKLAGLKERINSPQAEVVNQQLADASITAIYNRDSILPIRNLGTTDIVVVSIGAKADNLFSDYCSQYANVTKIGLESGSLPPGKLKEIEKASIVIAGVFSDSQWARSAYNSLSTRSNLVPVFFINPYKMQKFGKLANLPTLLTAYDDTPALRRAAAQALFGGIEVSGRFPVHVAGVAALGTGVTLPQTRLGFSTPLAVGMNPDLTAKVDSIVDECLKAKAFPGCQVLVAKDGEIVLDKSYGRQGSNSDTPVTNATIYDIASMSKATATLAGLMKAYDEGLFSINDKASKHIPGLLGTDKEDITVDRLLYHESGLPAAINMYAVMMDTATYSGALTRSRQSQQYPIRLEAKLWGNKDARLRKDITSGTMSDEFDIEAAKGVYVGESTRDTIMSRIYRVPRRANDKYRYSCLNFALLMEMEENLTGVDHDQWVDTEIFGPLGAWHTGYRPTSYYPTDRIAPTESDNFLRRQLLTGYVHDELAAFSGGVQGNAGLFSNAGDIAKLCQMWLNGGTYGGERLMSEETVKLFTESKSPRVERGLGFDLASNVRSLSDVGASPSTYGHTGFTGTCFWIDPEEQLIYVFLSNRVNPSRNNSSWSRLNPRAAILREIYKSIG